MRGLRALAALLIYAGAAAGLFLREDLLSGAAYAGEGCDPFLYIWMFRFYPAAMAAGHALVLPLAWAPYGLNVTQTTTVPLLSVLAWPLTAVLGPVVAFNMVTLAAPVCAALAGFVLCRELTGRWGAALVGGWVFGFSSAVFAPMLDHLQTDFVAFVPLLFWVVLLRLRAKISPPGFVAAMAALGACQFLVSLETYVTMAMFLGVYVLVSGRPRSAVLGELTASFAGTMILMSPFIFSYFSDYTRIPHVMQDGGIYVTDLLNFVVPTNLAAIGGGWLAPLSAKFAGNNAEQMGYVGAPLLAMFGVAAWRGWGRMTPEVICLAVALIFTLGARLHVAGQVLFALPWILFAHAPLLDNALPGRLMIYVMLFGAMLTAAWLAERRRYGIWCFAVLGAALLMLPASRAAESPWASPVPRADLFNGQTYEKYIGRDENVLFLPLRPTRQAVLYWQSVTGGYFRTINGYGDFVPPDVTDWPAAAWLQKDDPAGLQVAEFDAFTRGTGVQAVVVGADSQAAWAEFLARAGWVQVAGGQLAVYRKKAL